MSSVVFTLAGTAQAESGWSIEGTGLSAPVPAGVCFVDWVVQGGSGGRSGVPTSDDLGDLGGRVAVRTPVTEGQVFDVHAGLGGYVAGEHAQLGGGGATTSAPDATMSGQSGTAATTETGTGGSGGGAASVVYLQGEDDSSSVFIRAFGGDGADGLEDDGTTAVAGGEGGGGDENVVAGRTLSTEDAAALGTYRGDGMVTGTPVPCETTPVAPTGLSATPGDGTLTVSFTAPVDDATTSDVTGYEYSLDGSQWTVFTPDEVDGVLSTVIPGLVNGEEATVHIHATSALGDGADATVTGTPEAPVVVAKPAAPVAVDVLPGNEKLTVRFQPVTEDEDRPAATAWQYSTDEGDTWHPLTTTDEGDHLEGVIGELTNGTIYHVMVRGLAGENGELEGDPADWQPAMPQGAPAAPTDLSVVPGNGQLGISFKPGADAGDAMADVIGWQLSTNGGTSFDDLAVTTDPDTGIRTGIRSGLQNGQSYALVLRATSAVGPGVGSAVQNATPVAPIVQPPVTTPTVPAPVSLTYVVGLDRALAVGFYAMSGTDYAPTTGYQYRLDGGTWTTLSTSTDLGGQHTGQITGLTNGHAYALEVRGVAGEVPGVASTVATATPRYALPAPGHVQATVLPGALKVTWTAPAGAVGLTGYEVRARAASIDGHSPDVADQEITCTAEAGDTSCVLPVPAGEAYDVMVMGIGADGLGNPGFAESAVVPAVQKPAAVPTQDDGDISRADGSSLSSVAPGQTVTLRGTGFLPGATIELLVYSTPISLGTAVAGPDGTFLVDVTLPADLPAGTHHLVATGVDANGNVRNLVIEVAVAADGTAAVTSARAADAEGLAYTGADIAVPALGGLAALVIGGGLVVAGRRKRAAAE
ncbi:fibronectin type III domain-containing protein [Blastococcus sp. SYSU D00695]